MPGSADNTPNGKLGLKATPGRPMCDHMTQEMHDAVTNLYPLFDVEVFKRPLMTSSDSAAVLLWKQGQTNNLLDDPDGPYAGCCDQSKPLLTRAAWKKRIMDLFKNRYTKKHSERVKQNRLQAAQATSPVLAGLGPSLSPEENERIGKVMRHTWMTLIEEETPRTIFLDQNEALVQAKVAEIAAEPGNKAFAGGLQKAAEARAWDECGNKEKYEELAKNPPGREIARQCFSPLLQQAMKSIAQRKVLGDVAMKASVGWRNTDGSVHVEIFTVAYDASLDQELQFIINNVEEERDTFIGQVDRVLPSLYPSISFPLSDDNTPLWPPAETRRMSPDQVDNLISQFLGALWAHAFGSRRPVPLIPYTEINQTPELYYDTALFKIPAPLAVENADPHQLARYFETLATPFRFHSREASPSPVPASTPTNPPVPENSVANNPPERPVQEPAPEHAPDPEHPDSIVHHATDPNGAIPEPPAGPPPTVIAIPSRKEMDPEPELPAVPPKNRRKTKGGGSKAPAGVAKRKAADDAEPPKVQRANKRAKKTPNENMPPSQSSSTSSALQGPAAVTPSNASAPTPTLSRGLRQRDNTGKVGKASKSHAPPSKHVPVSDRWAWAPPAA